MVEYRTRFKRCLELWFDAPEPAAGRFDVITRYRALKPDRKGVNTDFYTLQLDLTKNADELLKGFDRNTRSQIRKSIEGDPLKFEFLDRPSMAELDEFIEFYDAFAASKGLSTLQRPRMLGHRESGCLSLTRVMEGDKAITWHANVRYRTHVGLMFSASHFRSEDSADVRRMIGRANRRLHWEELQHYKELGCEVYDFGGWYEGSTDQQRLLINQFKEGFGGTKVLAYASEEHRTPLAKLVLFVNRFRRGSMGCLLPAMLTLSAGVVAHLSQGA